MRKYIPFVVIVCLFVSCPTDEPDSSPNVLDFRAVGFQGEPVVVPPDFAGMCHAGYSANRDREYEILDEMGVVWLHRDFTWNDIQNANVKDLDPEQWNWADWDSSVARANTEGKKVMGMLLYQAAWIHTDNGHSNERKVCFEEIPYFTNYARETVKRYNGKNGYGTVDAWLIWNEPDLQPRFWTGTPEEFFTLTKATAEAIRELDEEEGTTTTLIGGVFTALVSDEWINGLFESGAMDKVDGVSFHPYGPKAKGCESVFNTFKQKVGRYGFAEKIWINEMGYPTYSEKGTIPAGRYGTDQYEGDMPEETAKTFTFLAAAGARNLTWYHLFDGANRNNNDSESWFGLVWRKSDDEWIKKGGYYGYALCAHNLPGKSYRKLNVSDISSYIQTYYFEGSDGSHTLLVWSDDPLSTEKIRISFGGSNHKLWNLETGEFESVGQTSTHTLYPVYGSPGQNVLFFTWD